MLGPKVTTESGVHQIYYAVTAGTQLGNDDALLKPRMGSMSRCLTLSNGGVLREENV